MIRMRHETTGARRRSAGARLRWAKAETDTILFGCQIRQMVDGHVEAVLALGVFSIMLTDQLVSLVESRQESGVMRLVLVIRDNGCTRRPT